MTRAEHRREVAEQARQLRPYEIKLDQLVAEAQQWLNRLRAVQAKTEAGESRHGRQAGT